jgi:diadenosine tetraphosphate (Ap4A) HIT family hydrolase
MKDFLREKQPPTIIHKWVAEAQTGKKDLGITDPKVIAKLPSGWAVLSSFQGIQGYCLLLADPIVPTLNHLNHHMRTQFLLDMSIIGDAILKVTKAIKINYEILGNAEPVLHAHLLPRYEEEPEVMKRKPLWPESGAHQLFDLEKDQWLLDGLIAELKQYS